MPRVTRAALLRSQEIQDESDIAASTPLPITPIKKARVPLSETAGNVGITRREENVDDDNAPKEEEKTVTVVVVAKKGPAGKGKKANATTTKKATKSKKRAKGEQEEEVEVLEDDDDDDRSEANEAREEEAFQDLRKDSSGMSSLRLYTGDRVPPNFVAFLVEIGQGMDDQQPRLPPSPVAEVESQDTTHRDPLHQQSVTQEYEMENITASVTANTQVGSPSPADDSDVQIKTSGVEESDRKQSEGGIKEESSVDPIKPRNTGRRVSRIEDSVEALDAFEEEIEKVGELIPATTESPQKIKQRAKASRPSVKPTISGGTRSKRAAHSSPTETAKKPANKNASSLASRPSSQPSLKENTPLTATKGTKRISSVHKAPFQPVKSTKEPTRPNFELPGEAVSRKLKEQREERLKREEQEKSKRRTFKARPVRLSHAPEVKLTTAVKARLSIAKGDPLVPVKPSSVVPKPKSTDGPGSSSSISAADPHKRQSSLFVAKRPTTTTVTTQPSANSSACMTTRKPSLSVPPPASSSATQRNVSTTSSSAPPPPPRPTPPTAEDLARQKLKGKEVVARPKAELAEREKARRDKEDAARKARAEAAERGRIASRQWAERQRLKREAEKGNTTVTAMATATATAEGGQEG